ncbi:MAB_1171c family putative transporter [Streptomyces sp. CA2R106]|uniref:MAB_1171c family putative transporter n=1 Tax=Streptomyces sp. CA2R106 TaxID=3120153 RepID=UPI00300B1A50
MVDAGTYTAGGLLLAFACYRMVVVRLGGPDPDPATRYVGWFALSMGAALLVLAPATVRAVHRFGPAPRVAALLGTELKMGALTVLALIARALAEPGRPQREAERRSARQALAAGVLLAALFLPAGVREHNGTGYVTGTAGRWLLAGYDVLFVGYSLRCLALFGTLLGRHTRGMPPSALRTGLRLMRVSGAVGAAWTLLLLWDAVRVLRSGRQDTAEHRMAAVLALVCVLLAVGGATASTWERALTAPVRLVRAARSYRALEPLWSALYEAHPGIALRPPRPDRWPALRDVQFALYRRVIEIHDGRLSLRPYYPADARAWLAARTTAGAEALPDTLSRAPSDAAVEAAALAAAVEARRAGHKPVPRRPAVAAAVPPRTGTIDGDVAWLTAVAQAFALLTASGGRDRP